MASEFLEFGSCYSSSSSRPRWNYDVFLSFRGEDTRKTFTDHLYTALIQAGIYTFRDNNELPRGEEIAPQLVKAIEGSRLSIVVFSKGYSSSRWCLDELVNIVKCKHKIGQLVLPIFYDMDPSDIRKQTGSYAKAFDEHKVRFKAEMDKVNKWREALAEAGNLSGWGLKNEANGYESEFIKKIVSDVACKLGCKTLHVAKHPVGIDSRVQSIIYLLRCARNAVGIVGIHGIAGIGKTAIAKAVFNRLYFGFEGSSFLLDVKEISEKPNGPVELQERLLHDILKPNVWKISNVYEGMNLIKERLHRKKVLVVVDDVDQREQLETLMGERSWFGAGSVIIVRTKNKDLLAQLEVDGIYHAKELDPDQSLQLFSWHAFRETRPVKDYDELSAKVVDYCEGLPLALQILGSHLFKRDKAEWELDIAQWQKIPHDDIQGKLKVSYDALNVDTREIFLDIACFFVGGEKEYVAKILEARYDFNPEVAFRTLIGRSLITIDSWSKTLLMHDILRKMGREIIRQMSPNQPGKRNRIWDHKDAYHLLYNEMGTDVVQGLALNIQGSKVVSLSTKSFKNMRHLKLLQIHGAHLAGSYRLLSKELIWLCWLGCPIKSLPSDFQPNDLVVLDLQHSKIKELWKEIKILNKLKILNLSYSKYLTKTPNFEGLSSLEGLILKACTSLVEVHRSIGHLKRLVLLNLEKCRRLKNLPESMGNLTSLQSLNITMCSQLEKLPDSLGDVESLTELLTNGTAITQLPTSARYSKNLTKLSFGGYNYKHDLPSKSLFPRFISWLSPRSCSSFIATLPASFTSLSSLRELDLSYCGLSEAASSIDLGSLSSLEILNLSGNKFKNLPSGIGGLPQLHFLRVEKCFNLLSISELPSSIQILWINNCTSIERVRIPIQLERLPSLDVEGCKNLIEIQGMECVGNNWSILNLYDCNNLSNSFKKILIQGFCKGKYYDICLAGGEIPEWFSHRGEGSSFSFRMPPVLDGNQLKALLLWVVSASTNAATSETVVMCVANLKNKSNGIELFGTMTAVSFDRNSTKHSWIQRIPLIGIEELQAVEELELNVKIMLHKVEKCGVHLIMEKNNADSDIDEKWDEDIDRQAGTDIVIPPFHHHPASSSTTDDQQFETSLISELRKWKISTGIKFR